MGLFDFFKSKTTEPVNTQPAVDPNAYLLSELKREIEALGYDVQKQEGLLSLTVNEHLEIATAIVPSPNSHPALIHVMLLMIHKEWFPDGIEEHLVGVGDSIETKVESALSNYMTTIFPVVMDAFTDTHDDKLDFLSIADGKEVLWHSKLGDIGLQGKWKDLDSPTEIFERLFEKIKHGILPNKKLNWLKIYLSRQPDGKIIAECLLNNTHWEEGHQELVRYAGSWKQKGEFLGQKQFIMFRRCDAYD